MNWKSLPQEPGTADTSCSTPTRNLSLPRRVLSRFGIPAQRCFSACNFEGRQWSGVSSLHPGVCLPSQPATHWPAVQRTAVGDRHGAWLRSAVCAPTRTAPHRVRHVVRQATRMARIRNPQGCQLTCWVPTVERKSYHAQIRVGKAGAIQTKTRTEANDGRSLPGGSTRNASKAD